jgi:cysteine synthase
MPFDLISDDVATAATACCPALEPLFRLIGHTPLLSIHLEYRGRPLTVHAKAEHYNFTGSIKDRMALMILTQARVSGVLKPGDTIMEATSGNAGIALAAVGRALGHPVTIHMPDWLSEERKLLMRAYGADLQLVSRVEGGFLRAIANTQRAAAEDPTVFLSRQFANGDNPRAHARSTAPELLAQLELLGLRPDVFVAGVGTGGTVMGFAEGLRTSNPACLVHPIEPAESPTLSTGHKTGSHRIQGVSDDFIPEIVKLDRLAPVIAVSDGDAILMAQRLARELGIGVGISSGANLIGAIKAATRHEGTPVVATVFCDDNKKYLSTDLCREEPVKEGYLTPDVTLVGFSSTACPR